jgi:hypothetical protein
MKKRQTLITIKDNFVDKKSSANIKNILFDQHQNSSFPWFLQDYKVERGDKEVQFTHVFYSDFKKNSDYFNIFEPLLKKLEIKTLEKIKANLTLKSTEIRPYNYHIDKEILKDQPIGKTAIWYLHTTNGPTMFEGGEKVDCIENRIVIFPSNIFHTGCTHNDNLLRGVINFNWF